jgi:RNA polymerase-binding transcription factor DksA
MAFPRRTGRLAIMQRKVSSMALSTAQLTELTGLLDRRYTFLLEEVREELRKSGEQRYVELLDGSPPDSGDESVANLLSDLDLANIERDIGELRDIEAGRARMHEGRYGICIDCGDDIEVARLRAYPTAKRCLACQRGHERFRAQAAPSSL